MNPRTLAITVSVVLFPLLTLALGVGVLTGGAATACPDLHPGSTQTTAASTSSPHPSVTSTATTTPPGQYRWDNDQLTNASIIVTVGRTLGVPARGQIIALAAALQESGLHNLDHGDRDSLGLFQQRPSQGWGTPEQIRTPTYAATRFYQALLTVPRWQMLPLTDAAQAVQHSNHPDAYAHQQTAANALNAIIANRSTNTPTGINALLGNPDCILGGGDDSTGTGGAATPPVGYTVANGPSSAARAAITWALAQLGTPYSYGGDCTDPHSGNPAHQCDCSSLIQQAYAHAGIHLPRTTRDQANAGRPVARLTDIQPGDLIFIPGATGTRTQPGHVGLYIGSGLIIQAPKTGDRIKLTKIENWAPEVSAVRRVQR